MSSPCDESALNTSMHQNKRGIQTPPDSPVDPMTSPLTSIPPAIQSESPLLAQSQDNPSTWEGKGHTGRSSETSPQLPARVLLIILAKAFVHELAALACLAGLIAFLRYHPLARFYADLLGLRAKESHELCSLRYSTGCRMPSKISQANFSELLRASVGLSLCLFAVTHVKSKRHVALWWMAVAFGTVGVMLALISVH